MDIKDVYYSKNNLDFNLNNINGDVYKLTGKYIKNYKNTEKTFNQMALLIFEKTPEQDRNLSILNDKLNDKCVKYFVQKINNKNNTLSKKDGVSNKNRDGQLLEMNTKKKHQEMVSSRNDFNLNQKGDDISSIQNNSIQSDNFNLLPFTLSDDFNESIGNHNQPIYNNITNLEQSESSNPMSLLEQAQKERNENVNNYQKTFQNDNYLSSRATDTIIKDSKIKNTAADPKELFETGFNIKNDILSKAEKSNIGINSIENQLSTTDVLRRILELEKTHRPDYIEKVHYLSINSGDRNWLNNPDNENRYNFKVVFNSSSNSNHAGIQHLYKNVNSVEVVSAILPSDSQVVPFDSRIYLNVKQHPYLLLQIDELDNVFHGTNTNNEKSFSHLLFDKEFNSEVLSGDYISAQANAIATDVNEPFNNKFKKGFFKFIPAYFEKKMYYNNPKAALNSMCINLTDPNGNYINTEPDVLKISGIAAVAVSDLEIDATTCFPNTDCSGDFNTYLKITTEKHFSNKQFRIGDTIKIKGFTSDDNSLIPYINRVQGHVILNLEAEDNSANTLKNKSFISNIYIAPKGELDETTKALDTNTESDSVGTGDFTNAYLINQSLQTNFLFKVVTRDSDTSSVINSFNV